MSDDASHSVPLGDDRPFVSRAGLKLEAAIDRFGIDPKGFTCADLGANVGGFTDCLLRRGAAKVYAVDTGYGTLDYGLRRNPQVVVMERTNAMHVRLPELCDLVVIDLGWTQQRLILPHAKTLVRPGGSIVTLVKPQYEAPKEWLRNGMLTAEQSATVFDDVCRAIEAMKMTIVARTASPITGKGGNVEYLAHIAF